jgi:penicillin amidase
VLLRRALFHALLGDELGPDLSAYMDVALLAYNGLQETVRGGHSSFWDDISTPQTERPSQIWARALRQARDELDAEAGSAGTLGDIRQLVFPHAFFGQPVVGRLFGLGPLPTGGDDYTVNVRMAQASQPQRPVVIPTYRVLFTPGAWAASRSVQSLGQSGHRFSPFRSDQLADWQAGRTHALAWNGPPPGQSVGRLRLLPAGGAHERTVRDKTVPD